MKGEDGRALPQKETEGYKMPDAVKMHNIDVAEFTEIINSCQGDVYMVTPDGDRLNPVSYTHLRARKKPGGGDWKFCLSPRGGPGERMSKK